MAKRSRFFFAALAAFSLLAACGGGEDLVSKTKELRARRAFTGQTISHPQALDLSEAKRRALAAPSPTTYGQAVFTTEAVNVASQRSTSATSGTGSDITPDDLFNWAERTYPALFPTHQPTLSITLDRDGDQAVETLAYRYWPGVENYVGYETQGKDIGAIILYGQFTNYQLVRYTHIDELTKDPLVKCSIKPEPCRPRVVSVTPAHDATGVDIKNVAVKAVFDRLLVCPPAPITGTFGAISGTLTCTNGLTTAEVVIVATTLPESARITATLSGFRGAVGNVAMVPETWSFTTRKGIVTVLETRVLTVNSLGQAGKESVSIIDPATNAVVGKVVPPQAPGFLWPNSVYVDSARNVGYIGDQAGYTIHRFNPKTGANLSSFVIEDPSFTQMHGIQGMDGTSVEVCAAFDRIDYHTDYLWRNVFACYNADTGARTFTSDKDFLGDVTEFPTRVRYFRGKYYVLMAAYNCLLRDQQGGNSRDGYCAGSIGHLVEIDAVTKIKGRVWSVGSMPLDLAPFGTNILRILKSGDKGLVVVDLTKQTNESGATQSVDWSAQFPGRSYPVAIVPDETAGVYYVSDWLNSVRVISLETVMMDREIGRISMPQGGVPRGMGIASGDLWVTIPLRDTFYTDAQRVVRIDRTTRLVKNTISLGPVPDNRIGLMPSVIGVFEVTEIR